MLYLLNFLIADCLVIAGLMFIVVMNEVDGEWSWNKMIQELYLNKNNFNKSEK